MTTPYAKKRPGQKLDVIPRQEFELFRTRIALELETLRIQGELRGLPGSINELNLSTNENEKNILPTDKEDAQDKVAYTEEIKDSNESTR